MHFRSVTNSVSQEGMEALARTPLSQSLVTQQGVGSARWHGRCLCLLGRLRPSPGTLGQPVIGAAVTGFIGFLGGRFVSELYGVARGGRTDITEPSAPA